MSMHLAYYLEHPDLTRRLGALNARQAERTALRLLKRLAPGHPWTNDIREAMFARAEEEYDNATPETWPPKLDWRAMTRNYSVKSSERKAFAALRWTRGTSQLGANVADEASPWPDRRPFWARSAK